jgi:inner membrane protein
MMAASHMVVGACAWAVAASLSGLPPHEPQALAAATLGSLLPDIDHPNSWAGRKLKLVSVPLSLLVGHRGVTHSLLAVVAGLALLGTMGVGFVAAPLVVGYLSHLAADMVTPSGVPLLWPNRRRFALPLCTTGGVVEILLVAGLAALTGWATGIPRGIG